MKNRVKKMILIISVTIGCCNNLEAQSDYGDFPYSEPFLTTTIPDGVSVPNPEKNSVEFTENGMQLTPAEQSKFGAIFFNALQFSSINGIKLEFEYDMHGGTGGDGFSVFLFDAAVQTPQIGGDGSGLGYLYKRASNWHRDQRVEGLSGGYLGIGFDCFGNHKLATFKPEERFNGIEKSQMAGMDESNNVTIRGKRGVSIDPEYGLGEGYTGYPVLITQPTTASKGKILNITSGNYADINTFNHSFPMRGGVSKPKPGEAGYRKVIVELYPHESNNGFYVYVSVVSGSETYLVINKFHYPTNIVYKENAWGTATDYGWENGYWSASKTTSHQLDTQVPDRLRVGFGASTGQATDNIVIRDVKITLPGAAEAFNDSIMAYSGISIGFSPLENDKGYTGTISKEQVGSASLLDPSTFSFVDETGSKTINNYSYRDEHNNHWSYDPATAKVTFISDRSFTGIASVKYSIKAGLNGEVPYNDEAYRSIPSTILMDVKERPVMMVNRFVQPYNFIVEDSVAFSTKAQEKVISFPYNSINMSVVLGEESAQTWCTATIDGTNLKIAVTSNDGTESRKATARVTSRDWIKTVYIKQTADKKWTVISGTASSFQPGEEIEKSFDGDITTMWHSNWSRIDPGYTITYNLEENADRLDYIIYTPRSTVGRNGTFGIVDISVQTELSVSTQVITGYDFQHATTPTQININPIEQPRSITFTIRDGVGGFASCAEMEFFKSGD